MEDGGKNEKTETIHRAKQAAKVVEGEGHRARMQEWPGGCVVPEIGPT
jgi:hypothetical protein